MIKCVSFNVNSIRSRLHQLEAVINTHQPDFIGLQETKVTDQAFPREKIEALGYNIEFFGQKTHYGVALLSKHPFNKVQKAFPSEADDAQRRFIMGEFILDDGQAITVMNGYFPQGESRDHPKKFPNKAKYYQDLIQYLREGFSPNQRIIVMGDMNIAPEDIDIGLGEDNRKRWLRTGKCSFLPEERNWLQQTLDWGLYDTFRELHPEEADTFSWFDYRSRGFDADPKRGLRIDLILVTESLLESCIGAHVDYEIRAMEKPSDHCPVVAEFNL